MKVIPALIGNYDENNNNKLYYFKSKMPCTHAQCHSKVYVK